MGTQTVCYVKTAMSKLLCQNSLNKAKMNITDQPQGLILLAYNAQLLKKEGIIVL